MDYSSLEQVLFPPMTGWLFAAKIFFILFEMGVVAFIVYVWVTTIYLRRLFVIDLIEFFTFRAWNTRLVDKDWNKIKRRLLTKSQDEYKLAIVEADLLVNEVLGRNYFEGKTLTEKLEIARPERFSDFDGMKQADQLYQDLVKDSTRGLDYATAKAAILAFQEGLKDVSAFRDK